MNSPFAIALRPFLPTDTPVLAALFRASITGLTGEDYSEEQQEAWAAAADDEEAFGARLAGALTLVASIGHEPVGFAALKDNSVVDLLYVHPNVTGMGVATALLGALEALAKGRGAESLKADASDTALGFFQRAGYVAQQRNSVPRGDVWLANTTLEKKLTAAPAAGAPGRTLQ